MLAGAACAGGGARGEGVLVEDSAAAAEAEAVEAGGSMPKERSFVFRRSLREEGRRRHA